MIIPFIRKKIKLRVRFKYEHDLLSRIKILSIYFLCIVFLHVIAMTILEGLSLGDALWVTLTTVTTVGYGDLAAQSAYGRIATIALLYVGGIFILAKIVGDYFDYRVERKNKMSKGYWRWNMKDHIVIVNTPSKDGEQYFFRLITQLRKHAEFKYTDIQILTHNFVHGLPEVLRALGVTHFTGSPDSKESLDAINIAEAEHVIILSPDEHDRRSDSYTFDILHRLREMGGHANILVECIDDNNRQRLFDAGAKSIVRPIRAYPELIVRAIIAPGTEIVLENMFNHRGGHTLRYNVNVNNKTWSDIVCSLMVTGLGTAMAYLDMQEQVVCNPAPEKKLSATGLIILVREQHIPSANEIDFAINSTQ